VNKWLKRFQEGREEVKDDPRTGRPSTSSSDENVERISSFQVFVSEFRERLFWGLTARQ